MVWDFQLSGTSAAAQPRTTNQEPRTLACVLNASNTIITASAYSNRFLFTGREWIRRMGIYDYRNRVYSPDLGRFLQSDPIRFDAGDVNLYRYVGNNAINFTDAEGKSWGLIPWLGAAVLVYIIIDEIIDDLPDEDDDGTPDVFEPLPCP